VGEVDARGREGTLRSSSWFERTSWNRGDLWAVLVWTLALGWMLWDAVSFRGALFYFDITEINYPYRYFLAEQLRSGSFARWCPWLYCGMPLFSESQAGYFHPLKFVLYPWMETWKALNLDTALSIWLAGLGAYLWLRRHLGWAGALAGAVLLGGGGYTWAHSVHTSMINALASVPFAIWGLECAWDSGRLRGLVIGAFALACQVFAGHLQDALITSGLVLCYGAYWAFTETSRRGRVRVVLATAGMVVLAVLISAVQWIPSKELLDRSPRASGLTYEELTYASWHPELLPTLLVREAYGTRARDTDWMDGFYPYHEMDTYLGLTALMLAVLGGGGPGRRDRWTTFWVLLVLLGWVLMLGKFTFLFDQVHRIPILGSSREPVRFHLWVTVGIAALAGVGVERLRRPGIVSLRGAGILVVVLVVASIPVMVYLYAPAWTDPSRWSLPYHLDRYRWLSRELVLSGIRSLVIGSIGWGLTTACARWADARWRARLAALLPLVILADLFGAHLHDVPTAPPEYWTEPPESARLLKSDPTFVRVFGVGDRSAGEPGYASEAIDFLSVRDSLDWSLPAAWGLAASKGATPMIPRRLLDYFDRAKSGSGRLDVESVSHVVTGRGLAGRLPQARAAGSAFVARNPGALPRARLVGDPEYADDATAAALALERLGATIRSRVVVEDPERPLAPKSQVHGSATIRTDLPELVVVETQSTTAAYLVLADTFDPGWSATLDGQPTPIRPAYVAFRAVFVPAGSHQVVFRYRPVGFSLGLSLTLGGLVIAAILIAWPPPVGANPDPAHLQIESAPRWRRIWIATIALILLASLFRFDANQGVALQDRWKGSIHRFTWGAGVEAMKANRR